VSPLEQQIWAAAYAAAFVRHRGEMGAAVGQYNPPATPPGFSCAEEADLAVEQYRAAVAEGADDREFLLPVAEGHIP